MSSCQKDETSDDSKYSGPLFSENIRTTDALAPEEERLALKVPPGFEVQLFASEPEIDKPINLTFDAKGRMWVTQSFEYPFPAPTGAKGTDRLTILEDTDHDGKADKFTEYSDTLNIPIGVLPTIDGAVAFSIPNVYKFTDADHDDKPESKKFMLGPFGYADTHGMVSNFIRGFDGWVHACHGFTNKSVVAGTDGDSITLVSGNTFRFRLDGSRVEQMTFGQVNPFGLAYDSYGYIYSTDSHSSPLHQLIRGGDYPHFGKVETMGFAPDMKPLVDEATALCGIAYYADTKFPKEFQDNLFIGDVVNSRVHRYSATWRGASPIGKSEIDFIKSADPWFRPVNIKLGPDGALYVADFYNAIIGHYEVPLNHPKRDKSRGRIWRITYKGDQNKQKDLIAASQDELMAALDADNLITRMAATDQLTDRIGAGCVPALSAALQDAATSPRKYAHAQWALFRLGGMDDELLKKSLGHADALVRLHTLRVMAEMKPDESRYFPPIIAALKDKDPHVQRAATELLSRYPTLASVDAALAMLRSLQPDFDTHLIYTARLNLRNLLKDKDVMAQVIAKQWNEQDAGFIAGVMVDIPTAESAKFLSDFMSKYSLPEKRIPPAYKQIARFAPEKQLPDIIAKAMAADGRDVALRALIFKGLLEGLQQRGTKVDMKMFEKWAPEIAEGLLKKYPPEDLTDTDERVSHQRFAIDLAGDFKLSALSPTLKIFLYQGPVAGMNLRAACLRSLMKIDQTKNAGLASPILQNDSILEFKRRIAAVMGEFPGNASNQVLSGLTAIPPDLQSAVVIALAASPAGKDIIFDKIKRGEILPRTLLEPRAEERVLLGASAKQEKDFKALTSNLEPVSKEKDALIETRLMKFNMLERSKLNLDSGRMIFRENCGVCHKIAEQGIGPQLNSAGKMGAKALMEKILDPNRNVSAAFKNYVVKLKDGSIQGGLFRRDEKDAKIFADITGKEFSILKKDIAEMRESKYTLMPDTFGSTISEKDFNLLVNYLLN